MGKNRGPDTFMRMNYLYQVSQEVLRNNPEARNLAAFYVKTMKTISTRTQSKMNPSIKRTICKKCNAPLIPGVTSSIRLKRKRSKHLSVRCANCEEVKRFLTKGYNINNPKCDEAKDNANTGEKRETVKRDSEKNQDTGKKNKVN